MTVSTDIADANRVRTGRHLTVHADPEIQEPDRRRGGRSTITLRLGGPRDT